MYANSARLKTLCLLVINSFLQFKMVNFWSQAREQKEFSEHAESVQIPVVMMQCFYFVVAV